MTRDIKNFTLDELKKEMTALKESPFRAGQIFSWIYKRRVSDFDMMNNLSTSLKEKLKQRYYIRMPDVYEHLTSEDGAEKFVFRLRDGNFIESVLIPAEARSTLCLSTQVGCRFRCAFCASGFKGFRRDLEASEILDQVLLLRFTDKRRITNYVFMGMGEPLDNYDNVTRAIRIMNDKQGLAIGAARITVSTCGIIPGIENLSAFKIPVNLSISLHAANSRLRDKLVPVNKKYPLKKLVESCKAYVTKTKNRITLEYILISGKNDGLKDAHDLAVIADELNAKVNLIQYSPIRGLTFQPSPEGSAEAFMKELKKRRINVTLRRSKGGDIRAACGQLAGIASFGDRDRESLRRS